MENTNTYSGNNNLNLANIFIELEKFNNIQYKDSDHSYLIGGKKAISGTSFIHSFFNSFDGLAISLTSSEKKEVPQNDLLMDWSYENALSTIKGTFLHSYNELYYQKRVLELYDNDIKASITKTLDNLLESNSFEFETAKKRSAFEAKLLKNVKSDYEEIIPHIKKFHNETRGILIPIASELIIGDLDFLICGTIDQLFYNMRTDQFEIWDWKTNKSIDTVESQTEKGVAKFIKNCKQPISEVPDLNFYHYSLQLSLYKFILEKNTNIKIGALRLKHFNKDGGTYYECPYLYEQIVKMTNLNKIVNSQLENLETRHNI